MDRGRGQPRAYGKVDGLLHLGARLAAAGAATFVLGEFVDHLFSRQVLGQGTSAVAVAMAALDVLEDEKLAERAQTLGEKLRAGLREIHCPRREERDRNLNRPREKR